MKSGFLLAPGARVPVSIRSIEDVWKILRRATETERCVVKVIDEHRPWSVRSKSNAKQSGKELGRFVELEDAVMFAACWHGFERLRRRLRKMRKELNKARQGGLFAADMGPVERPDVHKEGD